MLEALRLTLPAMAIVFNAVKLKVPADAEAVKFPAMFRVVAGRVLTTEPLALLRVRFP